MVEYDHANPDTHSQPTFSKGAKFKITKDPNPPKGHCYVHLKSIMGSEMDVSFTRRCKRCLHKMRSFLYCKFARQWDAFASANERKHDILIIKV